MAGEKISCRHRSFPFRLHFEQGDGPETGRDMEFAAARLEDLARSSSRSLGNDRGAANDQPRTAQEGVRQWPGVKPAHEIVETLGRQRPVNQSVFPGQAMSVGRHAIVLRRFYLLVRG